MTAAPASVAGLQAASLGRFKNESYSKLDFLFGMRQDAWLGLII
jgi:hypothetical protein